MASLTLVDLRERRGPLARSDLPGLVLAADGPRALVREVVEAVRQRGEAALVEFTQRFDGVVPTTLVLERDAMARAYDRLERRLADALRVARDRVRAAYEAELPRTTKVVADGIELRRRIVPVERAGCYVPGGRARYPSSVVHTAVVARVAGVREVVVATPPLPDGGLDDATLAACHLAGVDAVLLAGGAQAIAAMAYGIPSLPRVDVIVGPGNLFVSLAKQEVARDVGVPGAFAGPSEVVIVADGSVDPRLAAIDLAVQAEHGPHGLAWLVTWDQRWAVRVVADLEEYVATSPRQAQLAETLNANGYVALVRDRDQALAVAEAIAPEHLELLYDQAARDADRVRCAGVVFVGRAASAAFGDYVAGPSHVLPTAGTARFASVLGLEDFQRRIHVVEVHDDALARLGWAIEAIAEAEGLVAHADSIRLRRAWGGVS